MHRRLWQPTERRRALLHEARVVNQVGHPNIVDIFDTGTLPDGRAVPRHGAARGRAARASAPTRASCLPDQVDRRRPAAGLRRADRRARRRHRPPRPQARQRLPDRHRDDEHAAREAARLGHRQAHLEPSVAQHDRPASSIGTPQYLSPEQARGARGRRAQTDVYSLGVMAYELFLEQLPFEAETSAEIMAMHLRAAAAAAERAVAGHPAGARGPVARDAREGSRRAPDDADGRPHARAGPLRARAPLPCRSASRRSPRRRCACRGT